MYILSYHIIFVLILIGLSFIINYMIIMHKLKRNTAAFESKIEDLSKEHAVGEEVSQAVEKVSCIIDSPVDMLTLLPNRKHLANYMQYIISSRPHNLVKYALLIVNIDFFRSINNNLGHDVGDKMLIECARRIRSQFSEDCFVARMDGDEFGVILEIQDNSDIDKAANKILKAMQPPIIIFKQEVYISVSIGISTFPDQSCCLSDLFKNSSTAVTAAKRTNRSSYKIYSPDIISYSHKKFIMHSELHQAIEKNEFILQYQPKIDGKTSRIVGIEALIRWNHPTRGLLYPADFIPLAEETGVIKYIDEWVLLTACTQLKKWMQEGMTNIRLAVNLSAWQFKNNHLVETIIDVLNKTGIAPNYLELEITESVAIENMNFTQSSLAKLIDMGISISIDDFGTGYSSLNYLKNFPINFLKIDRSFIADIINDKNAYSIVKGVIEVAHALHLRVVAEGVESQEQLDALSKLDCDEIQGFHISKPLNVEDIAKQIKFSELN